MSPRATQKLPKCTQCQTPIDLYETFPGNICVKCHEKHFDNAGIMDTLTGANIAASFIHSIAKS